MNANFSCRNLNDFLSCQKKLGSAWSSSFVGRTLSSTLLEDLCTNFSMLERKVKMRALVSLIALDSKKKQEFNGLLKKLLSIAVETSEASQADKWVAITAGIVHERLFGNDEDEGEGSICKTAKESVKDTTTAIIDKLLRKVGEGTDDVALSPYFLPLQNNYIPLSKGMTVVDPSKTHFVFRGEPVDIMGRERKRQKVEEEANRHAGLINVNSPTDAAARRKAAQQRQEEERLRKAKDDASKEPMKRKSLLESMEGQGQRLQAVAVQSISLGATRGLIPHNLTEAEKREIQRTKKKALRKAREEAEQKRKAERAAHKANEEERQREATRKRAELAEASRMAMDLQKQAIFEEDRKAVAKDPEEVAAELLALSHGGMEPEPELPPIEAAAALSPEFADVIAQVEASLTLQQDDKIHITSFFLDTTFGAGLPPRRFLMKESPLLGDSGQKVGKELTYIELDYTTRSYKFITKKAYKKAKA
jgi:hypothetical protein